VEQVSGEVRDASDARARLRIMLTPRSIGADSGSAGATTDDDPGVA
jgi:hypothetical protein